MLKQIQKLSTHSCLGSKNAQEEILVKEHVALTVVWWSWMYLGPIPNAKKNQLLLVLVEEISEQDVKWNTIILPPSDL